MLISTKYWLSTPPPLTFWLENSIRRIVMLLWLAGLWLGEVPEGDLLWRGRQHLQFRTSSGVRQQLSAAVGTDSSDDASSVSMWYHTRQSGTGEGGGLTSQLRGLALRHRHAVSKHSSISTATHWPYQSGHVDSTVNNFIDKYLFSCHWQLLTCRSLVHP